MTLQTKPFCNKLKENTYDISSDIDECSSGTHDCSAEAACHNNKGSYLCSCLRGYSGDWRLCEGEMIYKTKIGDESIFLRNYFVKGT